LHSGQGSFINSKTSGESESTPPSSDSSGLAYLHSGYPEQLKKIVLKNNADIGFAFDGDGDRLITVNKNGQVMSGDDILAILSQHPKLKESKTIVGTIMSNLGLKQYLKINNKDYTSCSKYY